jgi:translation initiation factor IF-2
MAGIRAYKLAEELGFEREELLTKAAELGIPLRSAMVALDEEQVQLLREKLGEKPKVQTEERRVGSGVIRRRRKKAGAPLPAAPEVAEEGPESEAAEPAAEEPSAIPEPEPIAPQELVTPPETMIPTHLDRPALVVEDPLAAQAQPTAAGPEPTQASAPEPVAPPETPVSPAPPGEPVASEGRRAPSRSEPARISGLQRRQVIEGQTLREQDTIARQARGNVQAHLERRRMIVDRQSRIQSGRQQKRKVKTRSSLPTAPPKSKVLRVGSSISFQDFSKQTGLKLRELLRKASALQPEIERDDLIDLETASLLAEELGYDVQHLETETEKAVAAARSREDLAAGHDPPHECGRRGGWRNHPAHRCLPGRSAWQSDHVHRHPGSRGLHADARARREGHRRGNPGGRRRRRRDAADGRGDQPRQGGRSADHRRGEQDR